jgi:hypothetical protein
MKNQSILAFHFPHKTGSMFGYEILERIARITKAPFFSQNNNPPSHGALANVDFDSASGLFLRGPVRDFAVTENQSLQTDDYANDTPIHLLECVDYYAVCQVRDSLDLVVSQYFSHGWIHSLNSSIDAEIRRRIQAGEISIYEYALMEFRGESGFGEASILHKYHNLAKLKSLLGPKCLVLNYEEMMLGYSKWSKQMADFLRPFVEIKDELVQLKPDYKGLKRSGRFGFFGRKERFWQDPLQYAEQEMRKTHIRSPYPGDHLNFLTPAEISSLRYYEQSLSPKLATF